MFKRKGKPNNRWVKPETSKPVSVKSNRDWVRIRLVAVAVLFGALWLLLWARAWDLQIIQASWLVERVNRQHQGSELITGYRGSILDRNGQILARSVEVRSVFIKPYEIVDVDENSRALSKILDMPVNQVRAALSSTKSFVWLKRKIDDRTAGQIKEAHIKGVDLATEFERVYPFKQLGGQLLGFVNIDDVGLEGLEKAFDNELIGHSSRMPVLRDAAGRSLYMGGTEDHSDLKGSDLELTIDTQIQYFTEEALAKAVSQYNGKWGGCLVVDVPTGEILAWAEYPFFNPNAYRSYKDSSAWRARMATDALEQGSTIKPLLVAAALSEKRIKVSSRYYCEQGLWKTKKYTIRDTHGRGWLEVPDIIRYSSNVGAGKIGLELGAPLYHSYLEKVGFGQRTGLPIIGESTGILRNPKQWAEVDLITASFGQSFSATALQMAEAYLCLASGGIKRPLKLVKGYHAEEMQEKRVFTLEASVAVLSMLYGVVEEDGTGKRARIPGISVGGKTGTAQKAKAGGGYGAGRVSSFIGIAPLENPHYLVITMIDEPQGNSYGGVVAAPVFRHVVSRTMAYRGELPDPEALAEEEVENIVSTALAKTNHNSSNSEAGAEEENVAVENKDKAASEVLASSKEVLVAAMQESGETASGSKTIQISSGPGVVPDVVGSSVRSAVEDLMRLGLKPVIKGQGYTVLRQKPDPGVTVPENGSNVECILWLTEPGI